MQNFVLIFEIRENVVFLEIFVDDSQQEMFGKNLKILKKCTNLYLTYFMIFFSMHL